MTTALPGADNATTSASLLFADENPGLLLTRRGQSHASASLWRSSWSPVGGGHVMAIATTDTDTDSGQAPTQAWVLTDNPDLAALVVATFLDHWDLFDGVDLIALDPIPAAFTVNIKPSSWTVTCTGSESGRAADRAPSVQITWADLDPPTTHPVHGHPGVNWEHRPLLVDHHVSLAGRVECNINGRPLHTDADLATAYVTLSESWFHDRT